MLYGLKRVHKVVSIILAVICPVLMMQGYIRLGKGMLLYGGIAIIAIGGVILYMHYGKGSDHIKKYFITTVLTIIVVGLFFLNGYSVQYHYLFMFILAIGALYFDEKLLLYLGGLMIFGFALIYNIKPLALVGTEGVTNVWVIGGSMFIVWVALYLMTRWVGKLVKKVVDEERVATQTLEVLQQLMSQIKEGANHIDTDVEGCRDATRQLARSSSQIVEAISGMSIDTQELTNKITIVDMHIGESLETIRETEKMAEQVSALTQEQKEVIEKSSTEISQVKDNVHTIEYNVLEVQEGMRQLDGSIDQVNNLLQKIVGIARQTNLLALNASIEAARAGQNGKGFAVVADSVGSLAKETSQIVESINRVNEEMLKGSRQLDHQISKSVGEAKLGKSHMEALDEYFANIKKQALATSNQAHNQVEKTRSLINKGASVQENMGEITALAQENTATIEELKAIVQEEDYQVNQIVIRMEGISRRTRELREVRG